MVKARLWYFGCQWGILYWDGCKKLRENKFGRTVRKCSVSIRSWTWRGDWYTYLLICFVHDHLYRKVSTWHAKVVARLKKWMRWGIPVPPHQLQFTGKVTKLERGRKSREGFEGLNKDFASFYFVNMWIGCECTHGYNYCDITLEQHKEH